MFQTFKEFVENMQPKQIGFDFKRSAVEKIIRADQFKKLPFEIEYASAGLRKELDLNDKEIEFLRKYSIIEKSPNGNNILNKDNFFSIYRQITNRNPIL